MWLKIILLFSTMLFLGLPSHQHKEGPEPKYELLVSPNSWYFTARTTRIVNVWLDPKMDEDDQEMFHLSAEAWEECKVVEFQFVTNRAVADVTVQYGLPLLTRWLSPSTCGLTEFYTAQTKIRYKHVNIATHSVLTHELGHAILLSHIPDTVMNSTVRDIPYWGVEPELCGILRSKWNVLSKR